MGLSRPNVRLAARRLGVSASRLALRAVARALPEKRTSPARSRHLVRRSEQPATASGRRETREHASERSHRGAAGGEVAQPFAGECPGGSLAGNDSHDASSTRSCCASIRSLRTPSFATSESERPLKLRTTSETPPRASATPTSPRSDAPSTVSATPPATPSARRLRFAVSFLRPTATMSSVRRFPASARLGAAD